MLRRFLARAQAALVWCSRPERHRRKMARELALPLRELSPVDAAEYDRLHEGIEAWKTGEQTAVPLPMPTVRELEPAEVFAADPLGAPLVDVDRSSPFYRSVLDGQADWMSKETLDHLESPTGTWTRGDIDRLLAERGSR